MFRPVLAMAGTLALAAAVACQAQPASPAPTAAPAGTQPAAAATAAPSSSPVAAATAAATAPAKPKVEQRATLLIPAVGVDLDPWSSASQPTNLYGTLVWDTLLSLDSGQPQGVIAESWRTTDPTTWEVRLRPNKVFSDGTPVTSTDVAFVLELAKNAQTSSALGPTFVNTITATETPNPQTLIIRTNGPDAILPNKLSRIPIYPKAAFESMGREAFNQRPIGSGPMIIQSFNSRERVELAVNPRYTGNDQPGLTSITYRSAPEAATRVAGLRTGEGDIASQLELDQLTEIRQFGNAVSVQFPVVINYFFDTTSDEFRDVRVRRAFNHAVDRNAIVTGLLQGVSEAAPGQPVIKGTFGYNPNVTGYPYDENRARQLLQEAGFGQGFALKIGYPNTQQFYILGAETTAPYLIRLGIRAELGPYDNAANLAGFRNNTLGPFIMSVITASTFQDPAVSLSSLTSFPGQGSGRWSNPEYDRLYTAQTAELDRNRRDQILQQMMALIHEEAVLLPMFGSWQIWGTNRSIQGLEIAPTGAPLWGKISRS